MKQEINEANQSKNAHTNLFKHAPEVRQNTQILEKPKISHSNSDKGIIYIIVIDRRSTIMPQSDDIFDILGDIAQPEKPQTKEEPQYGKV